MAAVVCAESRDRAGSCGRGRRLVLKVLTLTFALPQPDNTSGEHSICSLKCGEGGVDGRRVPES